ncbi:MAG: hypoxanthine phosphoribosyltransferase, partial [Actinobacteria bacterium]|nr:hypoxanthine phosphoribosyltransferase [Actinomycetota bacterium]
MDLSVIKDEVTEVVVTEEQLKVRINEIARKIEK